MNKFKLKFSFFAFFLISIFILNLLNISHLTYAQSNGDSLTHSMTFRLLERGENYKEELNVNSLELTFPSDSWNLTSIQMNLTDITFHRETVDVETEVIGLSKRLNKGILGYAVQINLSESTEIYGVEIYGREVNPATSINLTVQINGYDSLSDEPNGTIYGSTTLNMSSTIGWYKQTFTSPVILSKGNYYLILNGTEMIQPDNPSYYWYFNEISPNNPEFFVWEYKGGWTNDVPGEPFLYKLDQRIISEFLPETNNMTAKIGGSFYPISNGLSPKSGVLNIDVNFSLNSTILNIPIFNNKSSIIFNASYFYSANNYLSSEGYVITKVNVENNWTILPDIDKMFDNYSIKFEYPKQWYNIAVKRNNLDITPNVTLDTTNKFILIINNTILNGASWEITANSQNLAPNLNVPQEKFEPLENLQFSINPPVNPGNITFILINSLGFEEYREIIQVVEATTEELVISYTLSSNPTKGTYKAYIYWNNETAAGVVVQEFQINIPFVWNQMYTVLIVVGIIILSTASLTSYKLVKKRKRTHEEYRQKIYNKYMDVLNLDYFIVIEKKTGLNIYQQILATKNIDASLITGFLEAIRTFGIELTGAGEHSQTIKLEYQQSKIIMSEFKDFRILLIMKENPSQDFLDSIEALSYDIDNIHGEEIGNFKGDISSFQDIKNLLDKHLETSLIYPLQVTTQDIKVNQGEKSLIRIAKSIMKKKKTDYFFVANLLSAKSGFQISDAETILNLIKKEIFQPKF
ncbi:hypothetical protein LCGC14_1279160 [marine sediment metagenome]|uniref:Uncharacterized protein n=1 Tax=marine sediment metagenome TaxID=412755 RepID=A0A0F9LH14_9ZZZZ